MSSVVSGGFYKDICLQLAASKRSKFLGRSLAGQLMSWVLCFGAVGYAEERKILTRDPKM
jgi:hypothetical protein